MAKILKIKNDQPGITEWMFECPGCECSHHIRSEGPRPCWNWNGDVDKPTFTPSLLIGQGTNYCCHSFITDGRIQYLGDCYHKLKGQTVDIPDWERPEQE